jgi:hypothetical protein
MGASYIQFIVIFNDIFSNFSFKMHEYNIRFKKVVFTFILQINNLYLLIKFGINCYNLHLYLIIHLSQNELATKKEKA